MGKEGAKGRRGKGRDAARGGVRMEDLPVVAKAGTPGRGWYQADELAGLCGRSRSDWDKRIRVHLTDAEVRRCGRKVWYWGRAAVEQHVRLVSRRYVRGEEPEGWLAGDNSPALERYRTARAEREEMTVQTLQRELVPRAELRAGLARLAEILQRCGETLARDYGPGAMEVLERALAGFGAEVARGMGDGSDPQISQKDADGDLTKKK